MGGPTLSRLIIFVSFVSVRKFVNVIYNFVLSYFALSLGIYVLRLMTLPLASAKFKHIVYLVLIFDFASPQIHRTSCLK